MSLASLPAAKRRQLALLTARPMDKATCRKKRDLMLKLMACDDSTLRASVERTIRWEYVTALILARRKERGLTIVQVARTMKTATYKIIEAEKGRIGQRIYPTLRAYLRFLDLEAEYLTWEAMNQDLVAGCSADQRPRRKPAITPDTATCRPMPSRCSGH